MDTQVYPRLYPPRVLRVSMARRAVFVFLCVSVRVLVCVCVFVRVRVRLRVLQCSARVGGCLIGLVPSPKL
jgi:hypothetical protein